MRGWRGAAAVDSRRGMRVRQDSQVSCGTFWIGSCTLVEVLPDLLQAPLALKGVFIAVLSSVRSYHQVWSSFPPSFYYMCI